MNHFSALEVQNLAARGMKALDEIMYFQIGGIFFGTAATIFLAAGLGFQIQVNLFTSSLVSIFINF